MDATVENGIRQEQIESFGRLMAGFSHDMKNHLGIIRESNGLMDDIIAMSGLPEDEPLVTRLHKSISSIEKRVAIAANMLHYLSGFAHRPDTPYSSFQINDLLTEEHTFLERFSRLKQIDCSLQLADVLPSLHNDPSLLQHVLYRLYILCLEKLKAGDSLIIVTGQGADNGAEITFRLTGDVQVNLEQDSGYLMAAIDKIGAVVEQSATREEYSEITLVIPSLPVEQHL